MEKILVFGGSGFIGTRVIKKLAPDNAYNLVSIDIQPPREILTGVQYITADVRDLSSLVVNGSVKTIYNFAAVHTTPGHPDNAYYETNIAGAVEILALARRLKVNDVVFTSSISVYGPGEDEKTENSIPNPTSAYGWSKLLAEKIHQKWQEESNGRQLIIVRPAVVFGPGEGGNFTRLAKLLRKGIFVYPGRRDTIKSCIYVDDLLEAIANVKLLRKPFVLFNACYSDRYTIENIVKTFKTSSFPNLKEHMLPLTLVLLLAKILKPLSSIGLGIHPERVMKLIRSTNIIPNWLELNGLNKKNGLKKAIENWGLETNKNFN